MGGISAVRRLLAGMITFRVADETTSHVRKCLSGSGVDECRALAAAAGFTKVGVVIERARFFGAIPHELWRHPTEQLFLSITGLTYSFVTCLADRHIFTWGHAAPATKSAARVLSAASVGSFEQNLGAHLERVRAAGTPALRHATLEDLFEHERIYHEERMSVRTLAKATLRLPAILVGMPLVALFVFFTMTPSISERMLWGMTACMSSFSVFQLLSADHMIRSTAWRATPLVAATAAPAEPALPVVASEARVLAENAVALVLRAGPAIGAALAVIVGGCVVSEVAVTQALPGNTIAPLVPFYAAVAWAQIVAVVGFARALERTPTVRECLLGAVGTPGALLLMVLSAVQPVMQTFWLFSGARGGLVTVVCLLPQLTMAHTNSQLGWIVARVTGKTGRREIVEETNRLLRGRMKLFWGVMLAAMFLWASALLPRFGVVPSLGFVGTVVPIYYFVGLVLLGVGVVTAALAAGLVGLAKGIDLHGAPDAAPSPVAV